MNIKPINAVIQSNVVSGKIKKVSKPVIGTSIATGALALAGVIAKSSVSAEKVSMEVVDKKMRAKVNEILDKEVQLKEG